MIDKLSLNASGPSTGLLRPTVVSSRVAATEVFRKTFGEPMPTVVDIRNDPFLSALFAQQGVVGRIRRRLVTLSGKNGKVIPAKGIVASALSASEETEFQDLVFVGVEFLSEYHREEETVAGVMAHEWGHLVSEFPNGMDPDQLTWDQIFDLRKEEEAAADGYAGKMLFLMNQTHDGIIRFLSDRKNKHYSLKYHPVSTRAAIIRRGFEEARRRQDQARNLVLIPQPIFKNPFTSRLIAVA